MITESNDKRHITQFITLTDKLTTQDEFISRNIICLNKIFFKYHLVYTNSKYHKSGINPSSRSTLITPRIR
ncbi:hypothetical protein, partial [Pectobacterium quasiaquaticum]|uniref:hypothetical protein n=1 Tax=Pectobacterium quasiaquaticum TaxID=2774015 RepID=UPI001CF7AF78